MLSLYRALMALRDEEPALLAGSYETEAVEGDVLAYRRRLRDRRLLVALNLSDACGGIGLPGLGEIRLSTWLDRQGELVRDRVKLRPAEGVILVEIGA